MKNRLLRLLGAFTFCLFFYSSSAQASLKVQTEDEVKKLLCNNWQITAQEIQGKKMPTPPGAKAYMNFKKDGVLNMASVGGPPENCTWSYQHDSSKIAFVFGGQKDAFTIVNISSQDLTLLHTTEGYPIKIILKRAK
jgi:hypothetical protein